MSDSAPVLIISASETVALRLRLLVEDLGRPALCAAAPDQAMMLPGASRACALVVDAAFRDTVAAFAGDRPVVVADRDWSALRDRLAALPGRRGRTEAEHLAQAMAGARILIVDDSVTYREFIRLELAGAGADVTVCGDGGTAMEMLARSDFDGVLVDLVMPGISGMELCSRIAALRRDQARPFAILALSSRDGPAETIRAIQAGADAFLAKAQDMALLKARIAAHLRRGRLDVAR